MRQQSIQEIIVACTACPLHEVEGGPVPPRGRVGAPMLIAADIPSLTDSRRHKALSGRSGAILWRELAKVGVERSQVSVTHAVCCYPRRIPERTELFACRSNLYRQMVHYHPRYILALGKTVAYSLNKLDQRWADVRGEWYELGWFMAYHDPRLGPMYVLPTHNVATVRKHPELVKEWRRDLRNFATIALSNTIPT